MEKIGTTEKIILACVLAMVIFSIGAVSATVYNLVVLSRYMVFGLTASFVVAFSIVALDTN